MNRTRQPNYQEGGYRLRGKRLAEFLNGRPLVSIITVVRNAEQTLEGTIESVEKQSYQPIEYVLVDGASTDGTLDIVRAHESSISYWLSEPDNGIYDAMNKGIAASTGQIIGILHADDWLSTDQIANAVEYLLISDADFVFGDVWLHGWRGQDVFMKGDPSYQRVILRTMPSLYQTTVLCSIKVFEKVGLFRTTFRVVSDYDWFVRVHRAGFKGFYDPRIVGHMQTGGISTKRQRLAICEGAVACLKNGYPFLPGLLHWGHRFIFPNGHLQWLARFKSFMRNALTSDGAKPSLGLLISYLRWAVRRILIVFAGQIGLLPRLTPYRDTLNRIFGKGQSAGQSQTANVNKGSEQPWDPLSVFLTARGLYGGLPDIGIEWFYWFGKSIRSALCLDASPCGEQIAFILEGAGVRVHRHSANTTKEFTEWVNFDVIMLDARIDKSHVMSASLGGSFRPRFFVFTNVKPEVGIGQRDGFAPLKDFGDIVVTDSPLPPFDQKIQNENEGSGGNTIVNARSSIHSKLQKGIPLRIVFLNDIGFKAGAGIALRRQVQSFLLNGHKVAVVCWSASNDNVEPKVLGCNIAKDWLGLHSLPSLHHSHGLEDEQIVHRVTQKIMEFEPDIVITGNLHWAGWPLSILARLKQKGVFVVAYMHDRYWITGRCVYIRSCKKYMSGCDESCPTASEYPSLVPEKIADAWKLRRQVFTGPDAIPLATNSHWVHGFQDRGFAGKAKADVIHLGLDHKLFSPIDRSLSRRLLNLPEDGVFILSGAIAVREPHKGGSVLVNVLRQLAQKPGVRVIAFGYQSENIEGVNGLGEIKDERMIPVVYSASDIFVNASIEESFGMTMMEASACEIPIVAVDAGGVSDIARHGENALLVPEGSTEALLNAIETFIMAPEKRRIFGQVGRNIIENEFTLDAQYQRWRSYLLKVTGRKGNKLI